MKMPYLSRAQSRFLRAFKVSPFGPTVEQWPSAAIMRRWLRRPGFVAAMRDVRRAIRYQADFQLLSAAAAAAHVLHTSVTAGDHEQCRKEMAAMSDLLKLAHVRERFALEADELPKTITPRAQRNLDLVDALKTCHPDLTVREVRELLVQMNSDEELATDEHR